MLTFYFYGVRGQQFSLRATLSWTSVRLLLWVESGTCSWFDVPCTITKDLSTHPCLTDPIYSVWMLLLHEHPQVAIIRNNPMGSKLQHWNSACSKGVNNRDTLGLRRDGLIFTPKSALLAGESGLRASWLGPRGLLILLQSLLHTHRGYHRSLWLSVQQLLKTALSHRAT